MNLAPLLTAIRAAQRHRSTLHGEAHWQRVAATGVQLLPAVPGADPWVVFWFALFHDSQRVNDGNDPAHGQRGGALAQRLHQQGLYPVSAAQLDSLITACRDHTAGRTHADPTIGLCWDADRLNLWRVDQVPDPRYLSTPPARQPAQIAWARQLQTQPCPTWEALYRAFERV